MLQLKSGLQEVPLKLYPPIHEVHFEESVSEHYLQGTEHKSVHFPPANLSPGLHVEHVPLLQVLHPVGHCLHDAIVVSVLRTG